MLVAVGLRLPTALSRAPLGFDDGVYLASAGALRAGGLPFVDVYSSQGPAFLPLLWFVDLLGFRAWWAPRLLPVLAGVALTVLVHRLALRLSDRAGAATAALLVATSGCLLYSTTRIEADGVAMAFGAGAVLAASERGGRREVLAALLLGVAIAVKSLLVAPSVLAVLWIIVRRRGWRPAALVGAGAGVVVLLLSLPWGLAAVWEQSIALHLRASDGLDVGANADLVRRVLGHRDRLLLGMAAAAIAWVAIRAFVRRPSPRTAVARPGAGDLELATWIWLVGSVAVLALHQPLFLQHLAIVVPPAALLVAVHRPPVVVIVAAVALLLPSHAAGAEWRRTSVSLNDEERAAIDLVRRIEPRSGMVISDAQTLVRLAGRTSPGSVVDVSFVRIDAGQLSTADVVAAASEPQVCGVLMWSQRLAYLPGLRSQLPGYRAVYRNGEQELWLRDRCELRS